ncbi:MAG: chemotaxis-specific protein-glutamate methyltransferase CheB [Gammaproteobacteria bacterium]|nr:MAG: chemotaxis-specific protein-glutamate methyltransferase CheB [Gammaproteobacteria bacterium]
MINILIADDSATETLILRKIFESESDMKVIGYAKNGKEAVDLVARLKPTIVTMDIQMPVMDGIEAIRQIMSQHPTPIVVISSKLNDEAMTVSFNALDAGALSVLDKPVDITSPAFDKIRQRIVNSVRSMSEIKVVKRRFHPKSKHKKLIVSKPLLPAAHDFEIIAIGTSVGGPQALKQILSELPADFPVPIVVVQHMTPGFISGFVKWLNDNTSLVVKEAQNQELLQAGNVYFAPDGCHLQIERGKEAPRAKLIKGLPVSGFYPSATVLLQSVAESYGKNAIGLLLTGMGYDGAHGLLELKGAQGHTLIQDPDSAVVFGMAAVAQSLNAVDKVVDLGKIAGYLIAATKK